MDIRKEKITKEQLIGVVCRSVAAFFLMLTIIILIIQKKRRLNEVYDENLFLSVESENESPVVFVETNFSAFSPEIKEKINEDIEYF